MSSDIQYRRPAADEGLALAAMARRCFVDTFGSRYRAEDLQPFLDSAYGGGGLLADLADDATDFRIATHENQIVAYVKLSLLAAPAADPLPGALELRQLYVLEPWQGTGIAETLMQWALGRARERRAPEIYLTVFDHNERAKRFYTRHGFRDVGSCTFQCGSHIEEDRIWQRPLDA